jgi:hypothetical protein
MPVLGHRDQRLRLQLSTWRGARKVLNLADRRGCHGRRAFYQTAALSQQQKRHAMALLQVQTTENVV